MGWATRNNIRCSDGRTIRRNAFADQNGEKVPLVWNHGHGDPNNVLGHAYLENRKQGVYAYGYFNDTESGSAAREFVQHGDIVGMSIYANHLKQNEGDVLHGTIREVSLVLAGANPGAYIESVIKHGEEVDDEAIIFSGEMMTLMHHDDEDEEDDMSKKPRTKKALSHYDDDEEDEDETLGDVLATLTDKQMEAVAAAIGMAAAGQDDEDEEDYDEEDEDYDDEDEEDYDDEDLEQSDFDYYDDEEDDDALKHNIFDTNGGYYAEDDADSLSHADLEAIFEDAKRGGSLKDAVLAHADTQPTYGIKDIDFLFPEARNLNVPPAFIQRDMGWVKRVMASVHHTPFSRIKSMFADITEDEARARGYMKGNLKKEEVFSLLKRSTTPTTIYKKQKLDRDDVIDITDFDVVAWLKAEMRMMLDEEIARAILLGDGRLASSDDKINEQNIRPVYSDAELYSIKVPVKVTTAMTPDERAKLFIRSCIKARKEYKGSGDPSLYTTEDLLTDCLLLEDKVGRVIYDSQEKLRTTLRVREIVTVPVMENVSREENGNKFDLAGIIVNLRDYAVGADKGGAVNMFDDFDIDYNAQKYLIETRCSGALIKPKSALIMEFTTATTPVTPPEEGQG